MHPKEPRRLFHAAALGIGAVCASTGACSLINSFDDVKQSGAGGEGATTSQTTTSSGSGGAATTSSTGTSTASSGGGGAGTTSSTGSGGNAGGGGAAPVHHALLVVSAKDTTTSPQVRVMAVLDAATGDQLSREDTIAPAAIVYDPATSLWYIFDADNFPPFPSHTMTLRVGTIADTDGKWTEITNVTDVPVLQVQTAGALNGRLVYRAYDPDSDAGSPPAGFAYLDTSHVRETPPLGPLASGWGDFQAESSFFDFVPTPGSGQGGQVTKLLVDCTATSIFFPNCEAARQVISVPSNGGLAPTSATLAAFEVPPPINAGAVSVAAASARRNSPLDVLVFPDPAEAPSATSHTIVRRINQSNTVLSPEIRLPVDSARQFVGIAIAECQSVVIVSELNKKQAYAIPLDNTGVVDVVSLDGNQPVSITFEPITKRAFMPFRGTTPVLGAYQLDASTPLMPTLAKLDGAGIWSPPAELSVDLVVAAQPQNVNDQTCAGQ